MSTHSASSGDFNRENQPATSDDFVCEQCGAPLGRGHRFCSQKCWHQWSHENPPRLRRPRPTHEEVKTEMLSALDRLRRYIEEGTS